MTIIVLEGPDMAGKTTLARNISVDSALRGFHITQLKRGPLHGDPMHEYLDFLAALTTERRHSNEVIIMDRWHVGELIYGPLLRGQSRLSLAQAAYVENVIQTFGANFWHVTADLPTLEDRYDIRGDTLIKKQWLGQLSDEYFRYVADRPHWVTCTATAPPQIRMVDQSPFAGRYIGPRYPSVLLLGDKRNDQRLPFPFVPFPATSGHWLFRSLLDAAVDTQRVGVVNANEISCQQLRALVDRLGNPPIVVLGNEAEKAWKGAQTGQSVPYRKLPHPQYMRRFQNKQTKSYGMEIRKAMR